LKASFLACPARFERATYALEGLANLQDTMFNNGLQCPDSGVRQNQGHRGVEWSQILGSRFLQAFVGKTDKFKLVSTFLKSALKFIYGFKES
jgi:hypothetical protein